MELLEMSTSLGITMAKPTNPWIKAWQAVLAVRILCMSLCEFSELSNSDTT